MHPDRRRAEGAVRSRGPRRGDRLGRACGLPAPHGGYADLFGVIDTPVPVYFSFGSLMQTGLVGGVSCYRQVVGPKRHVDRPTTYLADYELDAEVSEAEAEEDAEIEEGADGGGAREPRRFPRLRLSVLSGIRSMSTSQ